MAVGTTLWTYFNNTWQEGNTAILGAADHATWLGTLVFDGARQFDGVSPDLDTHCERQYRQRGTTQFSGRRRGVHQTDVLV